MAIRFLRRFPEKPLYLSLSDLLKPVSTDTYDFKSPKTLPGSLNLGCSFNLTLNLGSEDEICLVYFALQSLIFLLLPLSNLLFGLIFPLFNPFTCVGLTTKSADFRSRLEASHELLDPDCGPDMPSRILTLVFIDYLRGK